MDRRLIAEKLESLRSCVRRIEAKCQVGIDQVRRVFHAGIRLAIQGLNAHAPHQRPYTATSDLDASQV